MLYILVSLLLIATFHVITASLLSESHPAPVRIVVAIKFIGALTEYDDLILSLGVLPAAEDQEMRADGSGGVAEAGGGRVPDVLPPLPRHGVGAPDHEVVAGLLRGLVLLPGTRGLRPAAEQDDVRAGDIHGVVESVLRWGARDTQSRPDKGLSVQHTDVVQVTLLES